MSNGPFWEETLAGVDISLPRSRCRYLLLSTASIFQPPDAPDRAVAVGGCLDKVGWVVWRCCNCILNLIYHIIHINSSYSSLLLHFYNVLHVFILGNRGPASGLLHPAQKQLGYSRVPWSTASAYSWDSWHLMTMVVTMRMMIYDDGWSFQAWADLPSFCQVESDARWP